MKKSLSKYVALTVKKCWENILSPNIPYIQYIPCLISGALSFPHIDTQSHVIARPYIQSSQPYHSPLAFPAVITYTHTPFSTEIPRKPSQMQLFPENSEDFKK